MVRKKLRYLLPIFCFSSFVSVLSMTYDNRFIPLFSRTRLVPDGCASSFAFDYFAATASSAFDDDQKSIGIPEIEGFFDLNMLSRAIEKTEQTSALRSDFKLQNAEIPFQVDGKIQAQGVTLAWYQKICRWLSAGFSFLFMRVNTRQQFILKREKTNLLLGSGDVQALEESRRNMFEQIGLTRNHTAQVGFGDFDLFLRFGGLWDYVLKCHRVDAGIRIGGLFPSGLTRDINSASSLPFGADGHWGFYIQAESLFELREDIKVGALLRVNKRIPRVITQRISVCGEPSMYGATIGSLRVNPGPTIIFSPYLLLEALRKGLGVGLNYTLTSHQEDSFTDRRKDTSIPIQLQQLRKASEWGSDYFTINVFYDFGKVRIKRGFDPILSFRWDVPSNFYVSKRVPKTHRVSLGIEFAF